MDDLIMHQDAIDKLNQIGSVDTYEDRDYARNFMNIPSAQRKGQWILHEGYQGANWYFRECPFCHEKGWTIEMNFCPNCGADMRGEEDE